MRQFKKTRKNTQMRGGLTFFANNNNSDKSDNSDNFDSILDKYTELLGYSKSFFLRAVVKRFLTSTPYVKVEYINELIKILINIRERHSKNLSNEQQFDEMLPILLRESLEYIKSVHPTLIPKIDTLLANTTNNEDPVMRLLTLNGRKQKILTMVGESDLIDQLLNDLEAVRKFKMGSKYSKYVVPDKETKEAILEESSIKSVDSARPADSASISKILDKSPLPPPNTSQPLDESSSTMNNNADVSRLKGLIYDGLIYDLIQIKKIAERGISCNNPTGGTKKRRTSKRHTKRHKRYNKKRYTKKRK